MQMLYNMIHGKFLVLPWWRNTGHRIALWIEKENSNSYYGHIMKFKSLSPAKPEIKSWVNVKELIWSYGDGVQFNVRNWCSVGKREESANLLAYQTGHFLN